VELSSPSGSPSGSPAPTWLDELDLKVGPPWLSMGIRTLDLDDWLVVDDRFDDELDLKRRLLSERPNDVFAARPGALDASTEVLELITAWLATHHPDLPPPPDRPPPPPAELGGSTDREDREGSTRWMRLGGWCRRISACWSSGDGRYVLEGASLVLPSHWRLHEKLGRSLAAIHAPVPHYAEELEAKVDRFFDRLRATVRSFGGTCPSTTTRTSTDPNPMSHPNRSRPMRPASTASGSAASARPWCDSPHRRRAVHHQDAALPVMALAPRPDLAAALAEKLSAEQTDLASRGDTIPFPPWLIPWLERAGDP
jgi:hypothetical protein